MAIEAQPGFEPQRIAGAEANGLHFLFGKQAFGEVAGVIGGYRDFKTVLAGIAGAADEQDFAAPDEILLLHEFQPGNARDVALQRQSSLGPLQGKQSAVRNDVEIEVGQLRRKMREILRLAGGVDDQEQACRRIRPSWSP